MDAIINYLYFKSVSCKSAVFMLLVLLVQIKTFGQPQNVEKVSLTDMLLAFQKGYSQPASTNHLENIAIGPLEINGILIPEKNEPYFEMSIRQHFNNPFEIKYHNKIAENERRIQGIEQKAIKILDEGKVKQLYFAWVYDYLVWIFYKSKFTFIKEVKSEMMYQESLENGLKADTLLIDFYLSKNLHEIQAAYDDLLNTGHAVKQLMGIEYELMPADTELVMYQIDKEWGHARSAALMDEKLKLQKQIQAYKHQYNQSLNYPDYFAGFYYHKFLGQAYPGFQAGVSLPVGQWSKAKDVDTQLTDNSTLKNDEHLYFLLNKYFKQILLYKEKTLIESNQIFDQALGLYQKGQINLVDMMHITNEFYEVKIKYLQTILAYNKTALQIETYMP